MENQFRSFSNTLGRNNKTSVNVQMADWEIISTDFHRLFQSQFTFWNTSLVLQVFILLGIFNQASSWHLHMLENSSFSEQHWQCARRIKRWSSLGYTKIFEANLGYIRCCQNFLLYKFSINSSESNVFLCLIYLNHDAKFLLSKLKWNAIPNKYIY